MKVHESVKDCQIWVKNSFLLMLLVLLPSCSGVFYQPLKPHVFDPARLKIAYEDLTFTSKTGAELHGWYFKSRKGSKGTIVQFHGNAENISTHFYSLVWLIDEGYNLFTFDYEGYGKSGGKPSQEAVYEDALAAMEKGHDLWEKGGKGHFVIYGQSLGGAISARALPDFKEKNDVTLFVQDSTFSSYQGIAFDKLRHSWLLFIVSPLAFVLVSDKYSSQDVLPEIKNPTLVIVGQKDTVIPQKFGKEIYKKIGAEKKWLWKLPDGRHIDAFHHAGGKYRQDFLNLLEQLAPH